MLKIAETPEGRVVREIEPGTGFERAYRLGENGSLPSRSYGHNGPWLLCPIEQVPARIWALLVEWRDAK